MRKAWLPGLVFLLIASLASAQDITGTTCPGAGCITQQTANQGSLGIQITGTWAGTITFSGSVNNSTYATILVVPVGATTPVSTTTANGVWTVAVGGLTSVRVAFTAYTSGTAVVQFRVTQVARGSGGVTGAASGSVTSVALSAPTAVFDVSGSPVTTSGTLALSFDTQSANTIFAGPTTGAAAAPTFRSLVAADIPYSAVCSGASDTQVLFNNAGACDGFGAWSGGTLAVGGAITGTTLDTGQGANELFDMDQNVLTTSSPTFVALTITTAGTISATGGGGTDILFTPADDVVIVGNAFTITNNEGTTHNLTTSTGTLVNFRTISDYTETTPATPVVANYMSVTQRGGTNANGLEVDIFADDLNMTETAWSYGTYAEALGVVISDYRGYFAYAPGGSGGGSVTNAFQFWSDSLIGAATNPYFLWYDGGPGTDCNGAGVWRVNHFGILAFYNPCFAKYTPAAANFERIIMRWGDTGVFGTDNIAYIGVEEGGTGTARALELIGGGLRFESSLVTPASTGTRYLCISTAGVVTSSASACSGT
jgi:hypothetical protein